MLVLKRYVGESICSGEQGQAELIITAVDVERRVTYFTIRGNFPEHCDICISFTGYSSKRGGMVNVCIDSDSNVKVLRKEIIDNAKTSK